MKLLLLFLFFFQANLVFAFAGPYPSTNTRNNITYSPAKLTNKNNTGLNITAASNGTLLANSPIRFTPGGGINVDANITALVNKSAYLPAIQRFAGKVLPPLVLGQALFDLAQELGFGVTNNPLGGATFVRNTPFYDPLYDFTHNAGVTFFPDPIAACENYASNRYRVVSGPYNEWRNTGYTAGTRTCHFTISLRNSTAQQADQFASTVLSTRPKRLPGNPSSPSNAQVFVSAIEIRNNWPSNTRLGDVVEDAITSGEEVDAAPQTITGPASSPGQQSVTTSPQGVTTITTTNNYNYNGSTISITNTELRTTSDPATGQTTTSTTVTTPSRIEQPQTETCGLPGTPACKIDETGTVPNPELDAAKASTDALKQATDIATSPSSRLPTLPTLNWSFQFPTGCSVISIPAFAPFLQSINLCPFLSTFHEIMSIVWILGGLFGAISIYWRNTFSLA